MEGLSFSHLLVVGLVALLIFGPKKLPELGKSLGEGIREFKRATRHVTEEVTKEEPAASSK
jgi:sec-independent protein translocase protein TatA